jgi:hypothetical protein
MYYRRFVGQGYGAFWRGVIFDREYKNLDDLVAKSKRWFSQFGDGARFLSSNADYKWVWKTGEELLFRQIKRPNDYWLYHGQEFAFIGWNELTKYPTSELYDSMMSCNRTSFTTEEHGGQMPDIPLVTFSTTNPFGPGHNWVKRKFIDKAKPGEIVKAITNVFNPRTQKRENITKTSVRLFGSYKENRFLSPEYIAVLEGIKEKNKRRAWLWGDWDIVAGGALDDVWGDYLKLPRFKIPHSWHVDRSFDWGSTHPFSVGWWAEANGEEATLPNGNTFCPPAGTLIRIAEWYGTEEIGTNKGLKKSVKDICEGIKKREQYLKSSGYVNSTIHAGPADNQIANVNEKGVDSIKKRMADIGIEWTKSNKSPGSRVIGLQIIRDRLEASESGDGPGLFFTENCHAALITLPVLPRDETNEDDVDSDSEDHVYDEIRYRCFASNNRNATSINLRHAT